VTVAQVLVAGDSPAAAVLAAGAVAKDWQVRSGVHCGPMISGVLARQRYQCEVCEEAKGFVNQR
jgi:hypothetical protein